MKFSTLQRQILQSLQFHRATPLPELAKLTGIKEHQLRYHVQRFEAAGIIRPWILINPFALGYEEFQILFTLRSMHERLKSALIAYLRSHPEVVWFGELGGSYHFGFRLLARRIGAATTMFEAFAKKFGAFISRKEVSALSSFTSLPKRYLAPKELPLLPEGVTLQALPQDVVIDEVDRSLIVARLKQPTASERDLSQATGHARATISRRLELLHSRGVIVREVYLISAALLGYSAYRIFVTGRGTALQLREALHRFARQEVAVVNITACLGRRDFEVGVEVSTPQEASRAISQLYHTAGDFIEDTELVPIFHQDISSEFLGKLTLSLKTHRT